MIVIEEEEFNELELKEEDGFESKIHFNVKVKVDC